MRRTRLTDPNEAQLWPEWRHHAFVTNVDMPTVEADQFHRDHATVELAIRDLKEGAGLEHCPSGRFFADAAWSPAPCWPHNLIRWTARLGYVHTDDQLTVTRTIRTKLLALPGRLFNRCWRSALRLPARWPWARSFHTACDRIRSAQAILTNHMTKLFFPGVSDATGLDYLSGLLGDEHVALRLGGKPNSDPDRPAITSFPLVPPASLRQLPAGDALLVHGTLPPAHVRMRPCSRPGRSWDLHPDGYRDRRLRRRASR